MTPSVPGGDEAIRLLLDIITDPHWSPTSIADLSDDTPFGLLCRELAEIRAHVAALSRGELNHSNRAHGFLAGSLKATEANLRHLTWQMERVAQGDYAQSVFFMGEFSSAFNKMSREMHNRAEELSRLLERYRMSTDEDELTGLPNRRTFLERAVCELRRATRNHEPFCLALADIDHFHSVNDHFGHANGDKVLQLFAARMKEAVRLDDICCRFGGDEFLVLMPRVGRLEGVQCMNRLWQACTLNTEPQPGTTLAITASFGATFIEEPELSGKSRAVEVLERAIRSADRALMLAKRDGRNRIAYQ